jgi:hypothetical protein
MAALAPQVAPHRQRTTMRKLILGVVAAAAIATPLVAATAANAATTDVNGVVTVSKGEIMAQFPSMNEAAFQRIAMAEGESLTGSNVFTATTTTGVGCSDGTVQTHFRSTHITSPIALTEIFNGSANKVTGWTLGAKGASVVTESNTYGTASSGRFPDYATICAGHGSVTNPFATFGQSHSDVTSFKFNGTDVSIVVNPYVAPSTTL